MNEIYTWVSLGTAIVTASAAIISLILTGHQTRVSNKQHLFDRRIGSWETCRGLYKLYVENLDSISEHLSEKGVIPSYQIDYLSLTNNTFLNEIQEAQSKPLVNEPQRKMLMKFEKLRTISMEMPILFDGTCAQVFSDFVYTYQDLLFKMYQCMVYQDRLPKYYNNIPVKLDEKQSQSLKNYRKYNEVNSDIIKLNKIISNIQTNDYLARMENQIKI